MRPNRPNPEFEYIAVVNNETVTVTEATREAYDESATGKAYPVEWIAVPLKPVVNK